MLGVAGCHGGGLVADSGMCGDPLTGEPLAFGYLFGSHLLFDEVFVILRILESLGRREIVPHIGKYIVLRYAFAIRVRTSVVDSTEPSANPGSFFRQRNRPGLLIDRAHHLLDYDSLTPVSLRASH